MDRQIETSLSPDELAGIGEGHVAYVKKTRVSDLSRIFPGLLDKAPDREIWALFSANGSPILLSDNRAGAVHTAQENDLTTVSLH